jgi:hypothetical protein
MRMEAAPNRAGKSVASLRLDVEALRPPAAAPIEVSVSGALLAGNLGQRIVRRSGMTKCGGPGVFFHDVSLPSEVLAGFSTRLIRCLLRPHHPSSGHSLAVLRRRHNRTMQQQDVHPVEQDVKELCREPR